MDTVFRALGDPVRLAIVEHLAERDGQSLFELCVRLGADPQLTMSRQAVSKHIAVLAAAGIVEVTRSGRTSLHRLHRPALRAATTWLTRIDEPPAREAPSGAQPATERKPWT